MDSNGITINYNMCNEKPQVFGTGTNTQYPVRFITQKIYIKSEYHKIKTYMKLFDEFMKDDIMEK